MAFFYSNVPVNHDRVTVHNTRTLKLKQLNRIQPSFLFIINTSAFPTETCHNTRNMVIKKPDPAIILVVKFGKTIR